MQGTIRKDLHGRVHIPGGKKLVFWNQLGRLLKLLNPAIKLGIDGAEMMSETEDGLHVRIAGAAASTAPWALHLGSAADKWIVAPGTFGLIMPQISGIRLDDFATPELTASNIGTLYVYLRVQLSLTLEDTFVSGAGLADGNVTVIANTSGDPADLNDPGAGLFHVLIATIQGGVLVTPQPWSKSLDWAGSDTGTDDSEFQIVVF